MIRDVWMRMGVLGLAAAVGLEIAERAHSTVRRNARRKSSQRRIARNLANASAERETFSKIAESVRRVCQDGDDRNASILEACSDARLQFHHPAQVRPLVSEGIFKQGLRSNAIRAYVRNISPCGIGLLHKERIDGHRFLVEFSLHGGERLTFLVELIWQHRLADGPYHSGGRLVEIVPNARASETATAARDGAIVTT
jgi:hypothetical protein